MNRSMRQLRIAIVEDHPLYAEALVGAVSRVPFITIVHSARSLRGYLAAPDLQVDVVLLDLGLPDTTGAEGVRAVTARGHKCLVISAEAQPDAVLAAMAAGSRGYLTKHTTAQQVVEAIRMVAAGQTYISPTLASFLLGAGRPGSRSGPSLTGREREVLSMVAAGETDQDIAEALRISVRTVRSYLERVREKTGQRRRPDLTRYAIAHGLITSDGRAVPKR
ncbi:response regulator transcription factor [Kineosporia sp. A_224]|uniref:LuxR C-terminal-related transcriptional regulator n=1 Tax=Kineosporia sp. A_224 TaxID=1962180 RepID=UPI000B4B0649|nr:response regulator transcription factor [Kineosporia sp. A_224]